MIDTDYDLLCGQPRIREIYHFGGWYTVVATDIGRAPQPEKTHDGNEQLNSEPMPPGAPPKPRPEPPLRRRAPKKYAQPEHYARVDEIMEQHGELWIANIVALSGLNPVTLQAYFWKNKARYQVEKVRHENGRRRLIVRVRQWR